MDLSNQASGNVAFTEKHHADNMMLHLLQQRQSGIFCDVTLLVNGKEFPVHRCILANCSAYFESTLRTHEPTIQQVNVNECSCDILKAVLDYMYTGTISISEKTIVDILRISHQFSMNKLKAYCIEYLERTLNPSNCFLVKDTADKWDLSVISKTAHAFILANITKVVSQSEILKFDEFRFENFIKNKGFPMPEDIRFRAICSWIAAELANRSNHFIKLLEHIRWTAIDLEALYNLVQTEVLFAKSDFCMLQILQILDKHKLLLPIYAESLRYLEEKLALDKGSSEIENTKETESEEHSQIICEFSSRDKTSSQYSPSQFCGRKQSVKEQDKIRNEKSSNQNNMFELGSKAMSLESKHKRPELVEPNLKTTFTACDENVVLLMVNESEQNDITETEKETRSGVNEEMDGLSIYASDSEDLDVSQPESIVKIAEDNAMDTDSGLAASDSSPQRDRKSTPLKLRIAKSRLAVTRDLPRRRGRPPIQIKKKLTPHDPLPKPKTLKRVTLESSEKSTRRSTQERKVKVASKLKKNDNISSGNEIDDETEKDDLTFSLKSQGEIAAKTKEHPVKKMSETPIPEAKKKRRHKMRVKQCEQCSYTCKSEYDLIDHMIEEHSDGHRFTCSFCDHSTPLSKHHYKHMKEHFKGPPYKCDYNGCDHISDTLPPLLNHRLRHTNERPFKCNKCPLRFRAKCNLNTHMRCHSGEKPYACTDCNRSFATKGTLLQHVVIHSSTRPYLCDTCGFSTKYQSHLIAHKRIHTGDVFHCQTEGCNYFTPKRSQLACHMRSHLSIRQFICATCSRAFVEKSHLVRHERIHLDDKPFKCTLCDYGSTRRDKLKEHVEKYHPDGKRTEIPYKPRTKRKNPPGSDASSKAAPKKQKKLKEGKLRKETAIVEQSGFVYVQSQQLPHLLPAPEPRTQTVEFTSLKPVNMTSAEVQLGGAEQVDLASLIIPTNTGNPGIPVATQGAQVPITNSADILSQAITETNGQYPRTVIPLTLDAQSQNLLVNNPFAAFTIDPRLLQSHSGTVISNSPSNPSLGSVTAGVCIGSESGIEAENIMNNYQVAPIHMTSQMTSESGSLAPELSQQVLSLFNSMPNV